MTPIPQITVRPVALSDRLWALIAKENASTITAPEMRELNLMFASMAPEQDNTK